MGTRAQEGHREMLLLQKPGLRAPNLVPLPCPRPCCPRRSQTCVQLQGQRCGPGALLTFLPPDPPSTLPTPPASAGGPAAERLLCPWGHQGAGSGCRARASRRAS